MQPVNPAGNGKNHPEPVPAGAPHITILIAGRPKHVDKTVLNYEEVVRLYAPDGPFGESIVYTVDYFNGPPENPQGSLVAGQSVVVRSGMKFNVTRTDKS